MRTRLAEKRHSWRANDGNVGRLKMQAMSLGRSSGRRRCSSRDGSVRAGLAVSYDTFQAGFPIGFEITNLLLCADASSVGRGEVSKLEAMSRPELEVASINARPADLLQQWQRRDRFHIDQSDVEAIGVAIAVIDPAGRALIDATSSSGLFDIASDFAHFAVRGEAKEQSRKRCRRG